MGRKLDRKNSALKIWLREPMNGGMKKPVVSILYWIAVLCFVYILAFSLECFGSFL
jgi:hypothetical protein